MKKPGTLITAILLQLSIAGLAHAASDTSMKKDATPIKQRAVKNPQGAPACPSAEYQLSENKKWCVKRCPKFEHFSQETQRCESCGGGYMSDEQGNCYIGL